MTATWIDHHCHLPDDDEKVVELLDAAKAAGVAAIVSVGTDAASSSRALALAERHQGVYATVGLHPHDATNGVASIDDLARRPGVRAIGEAGLDYHYDHSPRSIQRQAFATQIELAHELGLPLVVHSREAWRDTFQMLDHHGWPAPTVIHCFTGGVAEAARSVESGAYVSFSGIVTFKTAIDVQAAAQWCPVDRILIETDSPYLAPVPHRGRPNQPAWVGVVGEAVAALRAVASDELAVVVTESTRSVYSIPA